MAAAFINGTTVYWGDLSTKKFDDFREEGWTLLPNGNIFTVDVTAGAPNLSRTEIWSTSYGWRPGPGTIGRIGDPVSLQVGPAVLLPDGDVFQVGANYNGTANALSRTGTFSSQYRTWTAGPYLPRIAGVAYSAEDGPGALLPNGRVLVQLSPAYTCNDPTSGNPSPFCTPSHFWEYDGTKFVRVVDPPGAENVASFEGRMLVLPSGQIYWSDDLGDVAIYTQLGDPESAWRPTISSVPASVSRGSTNNVVQGTLFNGLSLGASYGDDAQMSTNYPLVRITNQATGQVCYARTHDHATMGISDGTPTSTQFDVPLSCRTGSSNLEVVANGIPSMPVTVQVN